MLKSLRAVAAAGAALLLLTPDTVRSQDAAINQNGAAATANSILDLNGVTGFLTPRGLLIPRMTQAQRLQMNTNVPPYAPGVIGAGEEGMWVYQTNDVGTSSHGFYYWDGAQWIFMGYGVGWNQTGNTGTVSGTHFLGTIAPPAGSADLVMRTTNVERMRIAASNGFIGIGIATAPDERIHVQAGGMRLFNTVAPGSLTNTIGTMRYSTTSPLGAPLNNYHEGNVDGLATGWQRIENAERRVINAPYSVTSYSCSPAPVTGTTLINSGTIPADIAGPAFAAANGTPFPTQSQTRTRTQYLFTAAELVNTFGLCQGNITRVEFKIVDDDPLSPGTGAAMDVWIRLASIPPIGTLPNAYQLPPSIGFNPAAGAPWFHSAYQTYVASSGWLVFNVGSTTFAGPPPGLIATFTYNAGQDLLIEIATTRGATAGWSPRLEMQTGLGFNATRYGYCSGCVGQGYTITDVTPGATRGVTTERPVVRFTGQVAAPFLTTANHDYVQYDGALLIGKPNWAAGVFPYSNNPYLRGPGVIGGEFGVYDGNTQLSDHVFDRYFDGAVRPEDSEGAASYAFVELDRLKEFLATERRLPNMPSREEWAERGAPSLGQLGTRLWQTVEDQALYITELEKDLRALEDRLVAKATDASGLEAAIAEVRDSQLLTPDEQRRLIALLRQRSEKITR